jgi:tripartite-type tricarboxylate transporter receptor subunit TctC
VPSRENGTDPTKRESSDCVSALAALADPEVGAKLKELSSIVVGFTPEQLATHVQTELAKLVQIVKASGAQLG